MRLLLKFLSQDILSLMVVKFPGEFMGNGRVLLSGGLASSKEFGSFCGMELVRCFVVDLFCFVLFCFSTSGVPPNEEFQSRALGRGDWTTRNLVKNCVLGTCQAHYDI